MFAASFLGIETDAQLYFALGCIGVGAVFLLILTAIAVQAWQRGKDRRAMLYRAELEASLKQDMLERGMSADEIAGVMSAQLRETQIHETRQPVGH
jgi:hypothetical protein